MFLEMQDFDFAQIIFLKGATPTTLAVVVILNTIFCLLARDVGPLRAPSIYFAIFHAPQNKVALLPLYNMPSCLLVLSANNQLYFTSTS